ncbi:hypothetical protein FA15DRAFT_327137 [Coprinopsis marcescibilis]|uniref:Uncharacterized protein n=1 Tax=Coprinopsis marcescibilis TaxID=230819 RepID=A0A5C3KC77_COPMA|nr:hypothetical protein FA15DRAFT_327137 [Coprinopsis marcescibilis]
MIFSLCDTQLITTLAIMISGWIQIPQGLSVYHFTTISALCWIGSNTQLLAFFSVHHWASQIKSDSDSRSQNQNRCDLPDIRPYLSRPSKYLRALLLFCQFGMLIVVATLQSHRDWFGMFNCPMECVIRDLRPGGSPLRWSITLQVIRWLQRVFSSMIFDMVFSTVSYLLGILLLVSTRYTANRLHEREGCEELREEATWGFGQLVPMFLLLAPTLATMDAYAKITMGNNAHSQCPVATRTTKRQMPPMYHSRGL